MYLLQQHADWKVFFGHFHPVIVHLPIGILFIAFALELIRIRTGNSQLNAAVSMILFSGFISAILACYLGWLLSLGGDYDEDNLFWHQWMGISVAVVAGLLWLIKKWMMSRKAPQFPAIYTGLLVLMFVLVTTTGHLGGNLTHGADYLTANMPPPFRNWLGIKSKEVKTKKQFATINDAIIYTDIIAPAMEAKCWTCHNASKKKGKLRMDTEESLLKGGRHGVVIKPGDPGSSEIVKRLSLPEGDDKRMPPDGKSGLTEEEVNVIKWWITAGASFKAKVKDVAQNAEVKAYFKKLSADIARESSNQNATDSSAGTPVSAVFQQKIAAASKTDIDALKKENILVNPVSQNQSFLELSMINNAGFDDGNMKLLNKLSPQIVWLKLSGTKITDNGLKEIGNCKNLVRLNLEGTAVTNSSITFLKQLPNLEYLNIVGTKIDDNLLPELAGIKNLKHIYCWQSGITQKGADALRKINPGIDVNF